MKYKDWASEWLDRYVKESSKTRTYEKYGYAMRNHILPSLGEIEIAELTGRELQKFAVGLSQNGLSASSVNSVISILKSSLSCAVRNDAVERQYSDSIVRPRMNRPRVECFSADEQRLIENYIVRRRDDRHFGIVLCLYTGLRIGELLALVWQDIDFEKGLLSVNKSCHDTWRNGSYVKAVETPKTESSVRMIPIPRTLLSRLGGLKKRVGGEYVIGGETEQGMEVRTYQRLFARLLKKLGIKHRGFHTLRHTFATRALEVGMDVKTLSEILGHRNPTVTLTRYAHSLIEHKTEMMNRIGKLLV